MKSATLLILSLVFMCFGTRAADTLSKEECREMLKEFETMSNLDPAGVEAKASQVMEALRGGETPVAYFIAANIYAENLFNHGKVEKARHEIEKMLEEAARIHNDGAECKVIALRTQGQFFYKLGLYDKAADSFRKAMEICPRYDSAELESCFTWSSTLFWLVQSDIRIGRLDEAARWLELMDGMMEWLDASGRPDNVGYKQVMILGLKARIELERGDLKAAGELLNRCLPFIRPDVPQRAYVEYYAGRASLLGRQGHLEEELPVLERLIEMHAGDYKPITAEFLLQKGQALARLGRYKESTEAFESYISLKRQVNELAMAEQVDELTTRYEIEKLQHERDNMRRGLVIALSICAALAVIISLIIISRNKLKHKNKSLARRISELNRLSEGACMAEMPGEEADADNGPSESPGDLVDTGNRIVDYIKSSKCYLRADCSRDTIKEGLGVAERTLAKAIVAATGLSFVNYINKLRLKVSIEMLETKPEMTINDISTACGFGTVRQFQRIFKQHFDLSPSAYREARNNSGRES